MSSDGIAAECSPYLEMARIGGSYSGYCQNLLRLFLRQLHLECGTHRSSEHSESQPMVNGMIVYTSSSC